MANKVKFGIKNVYYAKATDDGTGKLSYEKPVAMPGARSISLSASGEVSNWYADNVVFFSVAASNGYEGDLVLAMIPDSFRTEILGETLDENGGFYVEKSDVPTVEFALLFQFEGDVSATRHCMYRCTATRPEVSSSTVEDTVEPQEQTITITAMPRISDSIVKSRCPADASAYANWFTAVQEPAA